MNYSINILFLLIALFDITSRISSNVAIGPGSSYYYPRSKKKWNNFNCDLYFSRMDCTSDPRRKFVTHYHMYGNSTVYLIIVNFNWNQFTSLQFLRTVYFPRFHELFMYSFDVVYFAPSYQKQLMVVNNRLQLGGYYTYRTISLAYRIFRDVNEYYYAGYFFMNDDSFIDPLHLNKIDLSESFSELSYDYSVNKTLSWVWNMRNNILRVSFADAYYASIEEINQSVYASKCMLSNPNNHRRGFYDFAYIAGKDISTYYKMAAVFYKHRSFLELAGPTMNWCLSHKMVDSCNHRFWKNVSTCVHLHPVKLSDPTNEQLVLDHINRKNITWVAQMKW